MSDILKKIPAPDCAPFYDHHCKYPQENRDLSHTICPEKATSELVKHHIPLSTHRPTLFRVYCELFSFLLIMQGTGQKDTFTPFTQSVKFSDKTL